MIEGGQRIGNKIRWTHNHPTTAVEFTVDQQARIVEEYETAYTASDIYAESWRSVPATPGTLVVIELDCQTGKWGMIIGTHGFLTHDVVSNDCNGGQWEQSWSLQCDTSFINPCLCSLPSPFYIDTHSNASVTILP